MIKIDVWMDYVCPFCYIGYEELKKAINNSTVGDKIEINYKAFQLDRSAPLVEGNMAIDGLVRKFGSSQKVTEMISSISHRAKSLGIKIDYEKMQAQNTIKAHTVYKLAEEKGLGQTFQKKAFEAIFEKGKFLSDTNELKILGEDIGLSADDIESCINDESKYLDKVKEDLVQARHYKISGVPFYVFNNKYSIQGAQDYGMFERLIKKIIDEDLSEE